MRRILSMLQFVLLLAIVFMMYNPLAEIGHLPSLPSFFRSGAPKNEDSPRLAG